MERFLRRNGLRICARWMIGIRLRTQIVGERSAIRTVLVFGSSFQRHVEDEVPARLVRFAYPVLILWRWGTSLMPDSTVWIFAFRYFKCCHDASLSQERAFQSMRKGT